MKCINQYYTPLLFTILALLAIKLPAQNLTGTWEGNLGSDQHLQLNIIQTGNKICGYTRDYVKSNKKSFCKAFFEGSFDKQKQRLYITGKYFIQNFRAVNTLDPDYEKKRSFTNSELNRFKKII